MAGSQHENRIRQEPANPLQTALLTLTRSLVLLADDLEAVFREITRTCAETLQVERVSLWTYTDDRSAIRCESLYCRSGGTQASGALIHSSMNPAYFEALTTSEVIAAEDAETDPRTSDFTPDYLKPLGIRSMLDTPILDAGALWGVLCNESVGASRPWTQEERTFAMAVANLVAWMLSYARLRDAERAQAEFLESANDMIVFLSPDGHYDYVNQAWRKAIGYTSDEAKKLTWDKIIDPEQIPTLRAVWARILAGEAVRNIEVTKLARDGRRVYTIGSLSCKCVDGSPECVRGIFRDVTDQRRAEDALQKSEDRRHLAEETARERSRFELLVGRSAPMQEVYRRLRLAAQSDVTVLLTGESGTGKELAAAAIHSLSDRRAKPFVAVNCSAIPEQLLESELFGHVKGAFTGAVRDKAGLFQVAEGGTLFLDEVAEMSPTLQVKVLRALQEREIRRVGDERVLKVDTRIITATNRDMKGLLEHGGLRQDFYYRIAVYPIAMPSLRERRDDIPLLVDHFVEEFSRKRGKVAPSIQVEALRALMNFPWPGNVRELRNAVEHAYVTLSGDVLTLEDLPPEVCSGSTDGKPAPDDAARRQILEALDQSGGNRSKAAKALGFSRVTLWKKMQKLGLVNREH